LEATLSDKQSKYYDYFLDQPSNILRLAMIASPINFMNVLNPRNSTQIFASYYPHFIISIHNSWRHPLKFWIPIADKYEAAKKWMKNFPPGLYVNNQTIAFKEVIYRISDTGIESKKENLETKSEDSIRNWKMLAYICAKWVPLNCYPAKAKLPLQSGLKQAAK
jgi:hypothetical protein